MGRQSGPQIAYLVSRFPSVTETFVLNEMIELRELGMSPKVFTFIQDLTLLRHPGVEDFMDECTHVSLTSVKCVGAQLFWLMKRPHRYLSLWLNAIRFNLKSPKFLTRAFVVVPKAATFARQMYDTDIAHIHAHFGTHAALAAYAVNRLTDIDYSVTLHAHDLYVDRSMLRQKLDSASFVATISEFNKQLLRQLYGDELASKVSIVRCGVDVNQYRPVEKNETERLHIVCVGSLQPYKGQKYLIDACAELNQRGIDFHCELIGDGECREVLEQDIERFNLTQKLWLSGAQNSDQVLKALGRADIFVLPSIVTDSGKMEGIPVALMEAMALELPVIGSRISGIPELVQDRVTGRLVEPQNSTQMANVICDLWEDPQQRQQLGKNARQHVLSKFDQSENSRILFRLIENQLSTEST